MIVNRARLSRFMVASLVIASTASLSNAVQAQTKASIALRDSFRIGSTGVLCTAQYRPTDPALKTMFDRGYRVVCRDASSAVGALYALRSVPAKDGSDPLTTYLASAQTRLSCGERQVADLEAAGGATMVDCSDATGKVDYRIYALVRGSTTYIAEGLSGYDSALRLGVATLASDRAVVGAVEVATTSVSDPAAFARVQAGTLDDDAARSEAYIRNNHGAYAESSEFFETLVSREKSDSLRTAEFIANQALQQSNMGDFVAANALFNRAERVVSASDGVTQRMIRNFRAIDRLNQNDSAGAIKALAKPVSPVIDGLDSNDIASGVVTAALANRINRENTGLRQLGGTDGKLTGPERSQILDGQASLLRGMALRQQGSLDDALVAFDQGVKTIESVRSGKVKAITWLLSDAQTQRAAIFESRGDFVSARARLDEALALFERDYPQSPALLGARARLAAYLARRGEADASIALYDQLVVDAETVPGARGTMKELLGPYFAQLAERADTDPVAAAKMFTGSQLLQRPGVAQTQALLARELSEGDDEASALFRLSVTRTREIARTTAEMKGLAALTAPTSDQQRQLAEAQDAIATLQQQQTVLQSRLGQYSRYRVLSPNSVQLADLQKLLQPDEAYYKVSLVGDAIYGQLITPDKVRVVRIAMTRTGLDKIVATLRDTIVVVENGRPVTYPFDVDSARTLYTTLFPGLEADLTPIRHMIYEPDGALLQLPPGLLIEDQKSVDAYIKRTEPADADAFDFTGIAWFGRNRRFSIAVSPQSFADLRALAPSKGQRSYLGLGQNALPPARLQSTAANRLDDCEWPLATWNNPIKPAELFLAQSMFGTSRSNVLTGEAFSDTALLGREDLNQYRILHFATHGLVTAPRPQCPARPALVTSFGDAQSDGLLSFKEIFDLKLDADLVILSACDTAGQATVAASRAAGIETGGNFALDGLVRAFVGSGARSVLASHWPVPDEFNATEKLISSLFQAKPGVAISQSLADAQRAQMDNPLTSHPYYWAAFILLGDGSKPLVK